MSSEMNEKNIINVVEIGKRLREVRKSLNLTLKDMSKMSGFAVSAVSEMELGKKRLLPEYLYLLSSRFSLNLNWLFTGSGSMFMPPIDLKWDFGKDNEEIREMIYLLENSSYFRHEILRQARMIKHKDKNIIDEDLSADESKK